MREAGTTRGARAVRTAAAAGCVALLLGGCAVDGTSAQANPPSVTSADQSALDAAAAAVALDDTIWRMRANGTGTFSEYGRIYYPKGKASRSGYVDTTGIYNLWDGRWASEIHFSADAERGRYGSLTRTIGPTDYLQDMYVGPDGRAMPWYAYPGTGRRVDIPVTASFGTTTLPMPLHLVTQMTATSRRKVNGAGAGGVIYGTVPTRPALEAAGATTPLREAKIDVDDLTGVVRAELLVRSDGTPTTLTLFFSDVSDSKLSEGWRTAIRGLQYRANFTDLGIPVEVPTPAGAITAEPPKGPAPRSPEPNGARV